MIPIRTFAQTSSVDPASHRLELRWPGAIALITAACASFAALLLMVLRLETGALLVVGGIAALGLIAWRPQFGLYSTLVAITLFEVNSPDPVMLPGQYLNIGLSGSAGVSGFIISPLEILLLVSVLSWLAHRVASRQLDFRGGPLFWPLATFFVALAVGLIRGVAAGGDSTIALWESRWLAYLFICYLLAANTLRKVAQVRIVMALVVIGTVAFAIEGAYRRLAWPDIRQYGESLDYAYDHTDVIFLGTVVLAILAWQTFGKGRSRRIALAFMPLPIFTLLAMERRAGLIAFAIAFVAYGVVLLVVRRRAFFKIVVPALILGSIYLPVFWNDSSVLGQPARAVHSIFAPNDRDQQSNDYRAAEKVNVRATILSDPVLGVGFGREYLFLVPLPDLSSWPFWHYEPHNNVLWIWLKSGVIGFVAFFWVMGSAVMIAANLVRTRVLPEARVFALLALAAFITTIVVSYVDIALVDGGRITVLLGTLMGSLGTLTRLPSRS